MMFENTVPNMVISSQGKQVLISVLSLSRHPQFWLSLLFMFKAFVGDKLENGLIFYKKYHTAYFQNATASHYKNKKSNIEKDKSYRTPQLCGLKKLVTQKVGRVEEAGGGVGGWRRFFSGYELQFNKNKKASGAVEHQGPQLTVRHYTFQRLEDITFSVSTIKTC